MEKTPEKMSKHSDADLVRLSLENEDNFLYLMKRYEKKLIGYIMKISNFNIDEAEDVLQEVFIKVYKNLHGFDESLSFSAWIYRITRNETITHFRKNKVYYNNLTQEENEFFLNGLVSDSDVEERIDRDYLKNNINKILEKLDGKYREALVLKFLEEKDYREISDILQKPMGSVATLISRGKRQFYKEFKKSKIKI
jgi:RNA polymerase sigma-70 factor (ECF subfamily)